MKKLAAVLLSLVMCLSLMAVPARAAFISVPDSPVIIEVGGDPADPGDPGDPEDPDDPGISPQAEKFPEEQEEVPTD